MELKLDREGRIRKKKSIEEEPLLKVNKPHDLLKRLLIKGGLFFVTLCEIYQAGIFVGRRHYILQNAGG